jgi:hypothetical protein
MPLNNAESGASMPAQGDAAMRPLTATLALPVLALFTATGCIVVDDSGDNRPPPPPPPPVVVNYAPEVGDAEAGVYWDNGYRDDIWYFDAFVQDGDGARDVTEVWADVYDDYGRGDGYIESFELFPTNDPNVWFSDWMGSSTYLDPYYAGYSVDIVAYDSYGDTGYVTVMPYTY